MNSTYEFTLYFKKKNEFTLKDELKLKTENFRGTRS